MRNTLFLAFGLLLFTGNPEAFAQEKAGTLTINQEAGIEELQEAYNSREKKLEGYRVQIYNGRKDACTAKRAEFKKYYPNIQVYTLYEAPEYRLQAGDFRSRLEAEKFLKEVKSTFSGCFVVKTTIELPPI